MCNSNVKLNIAELFAQNSIKCSNCSAILKLSHYPTQFAAKIVTIEADDSPNPRKASLQIFTEQFTDIHLSNLLDIGDEITAAITAYYQGNSIKSKSIEHFPITPLTKLQPQLIITYTIIHLYQY